MSDPRLIEAVELLSTYTCDGCPGDTRASGIQEAVRLVIEVLRDHLAVQPTAAGTAVQETDKWES